MVNINLSKLNSFLNFCNHSQIYEAFNILSVMKVLDAPSPVFQEITAAEPDQSSLFPNSGHKVIIARKKCSEINILSFIFLLVRDRGLTSPESGAETKAAGVVQQLSKLKKEMRQMKTDLIKVTTYLFIYSFIYLFHFQVHNNKREQNKYKGIHVEYETVK